MTTRKEPVRSLTTSVDIPARTRAKVNAVLDQHDASPHRDPSRSIPGSDPGAYGRMASSEMSGSTLAVCFPRDDGEFTARVQTLLDGSPSEGPFAAAVQALLRETYPLAVISPRHDFAALDGRRVWYAFRDGSAISSVDGDTS